MLANRLKPTGDLARWESRHPFDREDYVDPILAFRIRNRRRHHDHDDSPALTSNRELWTALIAGD